MDFATDEARELFFYATTDGENYKRFLLPAYQLLERKWQKGVFDRLRAIKWLTNSTLRYVANRYVEEFGTADQPVRRLFPPDVRQEAASQIVDAFVNELEIGNSYLLP
jgi:hypothetical protein